MSDDVKEITRWVDRLIRDSEALASLREFMWEHEGCSQMRMGFTKDTIYCHDEWKHVGTDKPEWTLPAKEGT